jgi:glucose-1-phosphate thymidylyltransferase
LKTGSIKAAVFKMGYIYEAQFITLAKPSLKSGYGKNLLGMLNRK